MRRQVKELARAVAASPQKKKPRGPAGAPQLRPFHFKKGQSGNPGGKPKMLMKFSAMLAERLMEKCPMALARQLDLKLGATYFDALIAAQILNAATGDTPSFMAVHDILEGRLPTKMLNLSVSAEAFLQDPGFREFLKLHHAEYTNGRGTRSIAGEVVPSLPAAEAPEGD
jgi:hypothetical protein